MSRPTNGHRSILSRSRFHWRYTFRKTDCQAPGHQVTARDKCVVFLQRSSAVPYTHTVERCPFYITRTSYPAFIAYEIPKTMQPDPFPCSIPRREVLQGPNSLLIISHTGSVFDYEHQTLIAGTVVGSDRMRQLLEQSHSDHRPFCIDFPTRALVAASPAFAEAYDSQGYPPQIPLSAGNVLPGFSMCVLDW